MANGTVVRPDKAVETIEILPPKVTSKVTSKDGDLKVELKQETSTQEVKVIYLDADTVFKPISSVIVDEITEMTKAQYSKQILACGTITDGQLAAFRLAFLTEKMSGMYKSFKKANEASALNAARKFYKDLRERGFSKEEAAKLANYNPLD